MIKGILYINAKRFVVYIFMTFLAILAIIPVYIMIINATRSTMEINAGISLLPGKHLLSNWKFLTRFDVPFYKGFFNSVIISLGSTVLAVYFNSMTAYGLHVYAFKGRRVLWSIILIVMMLPGSLSFIGFYQFMARLKLLDSYIPLIVPSISMATMVLFLRQYMSSVISQDIIDAARVDGAGEFYIFNRIILFLLKPALAAQAIFTFVASWNNFFTPFLLLTSMKKYTLPMFVVLLRGDIYKTELGGIYLGIAFSIVPIMIFYAFMSRYILSGVTMGSLKE
ncbi:MAG: carbohydrate ABC transporter permease [Treponema sp.]|jgi:multiple sugar transport system permease protein|nr:carbohydrate ABC transporter permease [Treponema sp.]